MKIAFMALLGMIEQQKSSKDIEAKRKRNRDNSQGDKEVDEQKKAKTIAGIT